MFALFFCGFLAVLAIGGFVTIRFLWRIGTALAQATGLTSKPFFSSSRFENQSTFDSTNMLLFPPTRKALLLLGAVSFDILFWQQLLGINLLLWTLFVTAVVVVEEPTARRSPSFWAVAGGAVLAAVCTTLYSSGAAKLAAWASLGLLVGFANQPQLRLLSNALLTGLGNIWHVLTALLGQMRRVRFASESLRRGWYYGRLLLVPAVLLLVFHFLFVAANPRYAALAQRFGIWLDHYLTWLLDRISVPHVLFFLFGTVMTAGLLFRVAVAWFRDQENGRTEFITRIRRPRLPKLSQGDERGSNSTMALRKEYLAALAALVLINVLLLIENIIDVQWLWFGFTPGPKFDLAQFVHEGTYVLILSILLAMAIVLYFFRRNLNFYQRAARRLRPLATVWVLQNAVLAVSVGLRNYYYITHMGLAYKRIGVYAFLFLTLFGLGTVLLKIWQQRSAFSLVRLNAWAVYVVLIGLALGNWEIWIARYNLQPQFAACLDEEFLLEMPARVLPELAMHRDAFHVQRIEAEKAVGTVLDHRIRQFISDYPTRNWQSWNYADEQAYRKLKLNPSIAKR